MERRTESAGSAGHRSIVHMPAQKAPWMHTSQIVLLKRSCVNLATEMVKGVNTPTNQIARNSNGKRVIQVVSACSGLGTEAFALGNLRKEHKLVMVAETQKHLRQWLRLHHSPEVVARDVRSKGFQQNGDDTDLFVAGFPCQSFSSAGENLALDDPRGELVHAILDWLQSHRPRSFILENVKGLATRHKQVLKGLLARIREIPASSGLGGNYVVRWKVLNSLDFSVPQVSWGSQNAQMSSQASSKI